MSHRVLLGALLLPLGAFAQGFVPRVQHEGRVEVAAAREGRLTVGAGLNIPSGNYLRVAALVQGGRARDGSGIGELLVVSRYHLDPFGEHRVGLYGITGGALIRAGARTDTRLVVGIGLEGPRSRAGPWAVELALGDGARLAIVRRTRRQNGR